MYIGKLTVRNFRCFLETEFELNYPGRRATAQRSLPRRNRNVNLFLGGNGSGKSSIFKAVALSVLAPVIQSSGLQAEYLVRRTAEDAPVGNGVKASPSRSNADLRSHLVLDERAAALDGEASRRVIG